jgi:hypothetical protein
LDSQLSFKPSTYQAHSLYKISLVFAVFLFCSNTHLQDHFLGKYLC